MKQKRKRKEKLPKTQINWADWKQAVQGLTTLNISGPNTENNQGPNTINILVARHWQTRTKVKILNDQSKLSVRKQFRLLNSSYKTVKYYKNKLTNKF